MVPYKKLKLQWDKVKSCVEIADIAFIGLRVIIFCGGIGWLIFSDISQKTFGYVSGIFVYFVIYSIFVYSCLFLYPQKKNVVYGLALFFDLSYASLLVKVTGGFDNRPLFFLFRTLVRISDSCHSGRIILFKLRLCIQ